MAIIINDPFKIEIDVSEFDEKLLSIKLVCVLSSESIKGNFSIGFNFWMFCKDFDAFGKKEIKTLTDITGVQKIFLEDNKLIICPTYSGPNTNFNCRIESEITEESVQIFASKFLEFNKWW